MADINDLTIATLDTIDAFELTTGAYLFTLDELQKASIHQTQDKTDITGKQGRKLSSFKKNKAVTVSGDNGIVSGGLMEMQTGCKFENKITEVMWTDYQIVTGDKAQTAYRAVGTTGNEIETVYVKNTDGTLGKKLTQNATVAAGQFTYDPASKELAFNAGEIPDSTEVVVYYKRRIQASVLNNMSDKYSGKCSLYINGTAEDKCGNVYRLQFFIPKADFNGEFTIDMGGDQTIHSFEAESLSGAGCGYHNQSGQLFTYTVFGANAEDAA